MQFVRKIGPLLLYRASFADPPEARHGDPIWPSHTCKRGRVLKKEPEKKNGKFRYGFASDARALVEEQYTEFKGQKYEAFREYADE
jgi:hypothetical protein